MELTQKDKDTLIVRKKNGSAQSIFYLVSDLVSLRGIRTNFIRAQTPFSDGPSTVTFRFDTD